MRVGEAMMWAYGVARGCAKIELLYFLCKLIYENLRCDFKNGVSLPDYFTGVYCIV